MEGPLICPTTALTFVGSVLAVHVGHVGGVAGRAAAAEGIAAAVPRSSPGGCSATTAASGFWEASRM